MKKKILNKKLFLNKESISNLNEVKGGLAATTSAYFCCVTGSDANCCATGSDVACCVTTQPGSDISGCACC
ncbi:MAG: class I lanthipeptide [Bacteroidales bacterium]|nr:class I lanthipeptide [Bacteroidales bacterium]